MEITSQHITSFRNRLFYPIFFLLLILIFCFFLFQYKRESYFKEQSFNNILTEYANSIDALVERNGIDTNQLDSVQRLIPRHHFRITILSLQGDVLYDSEKKESTIFDNHFQRPEVQTATQKGNGYNIRFSETYKQIFFYSANLYKNYIIRTSFPYNKELMNEMKIDKGFVYFTVLMFFFMIFILIRYSNRLGKSISRLQEFAKKADKNESLKMSLTFPDDELGDISHHIIQIYNRLSSTKDALFIEREKLIKHLQFSREGLSIFSSKKEEILANSLFIQYINIIANYNIISSEEVFQMVELRKITMFINQHIGLNKKNIDSVISDSIKVSKNGKTFLVKCLIFQDKTFEISINDITQEEEESTLKKQLTQNISHELKTPVSSIQGYIETILTKPDLPAETRINFTERCFTQITRLSNLISDISLLNRMDEVDELFQTEEVDIKKLIHEMLEDVSLSLKEKNITTQVQLPETIHIQGNYALLYSIFRNLTDNVIAYAGDNCSLFIDCYRKDENYYYFSFSDNGNGVEEEHLNRLFERFYRVDKGRTRKMGGTGLGLSIVKNAVQIHKGTISAKTRQGGGLEFLFSLCKK